MDIYGEKLPHGYKVKYISKTVSVQAPPQPIVEVKDKDQNGKEIPPGTSKLIRAGRDTIFVEVYKQYLNEKDEVVDSVFMYKSKYSGKPALYYENTAPGPTAAPAQ